MANMDAASGRTDSILLLRPPLWNSVCAPAPPLGIGYLLTNLSRAGMPAAFLDLNHGKQAVAQLRGLLAGPERPRVVGVQVYSNELAAVRRTCQVVRELAGRDTVIVAGGPHVSTMPESLFTHLPEADYGLQADGELALPQLLRALRAGGDGRDRIPGLVFRRNGGAGFNPAFLPPDLDALGAPDWDGLRVERYNADAFGGGFLGRQPAMCIQTARGCPFRCSFCAVEAIAGRALRRHSGDAVAAQVQDLVRRGYREIKILDDNFGADIRHVRAVREAFERARLDVAVSFACGLHVATIDEELIDHIKRMGAYEVMVAVESGTDRVLADINKGITTAMAREKIALLVRHGLPATGFFIVGYPTETRKDIKRTAAFARSLPLERAHFNCFSPYPSSAIYNQLKAEGRLADIDLKAVQFETVSYSFVPGVSAAELTGLRRMAILRFYLRPRAMLAFLAGMTTWPIARFRIRKALEYFGLRRARVRRLIE
jgi:radical SAM superfamily enzyme YgiQ (UPF0313 family)